MVSSVSREMVSTLGQQGAAQPDAQRGADVLADLGTQPAQELSRTWATTAS
ncbi:MAG: hypothetical protein JO287_03815 [Pseudonocardiales bacterium]|nr:hypothetical protein [Pseudonocardiales bacterium]